MYSIKYSTIFASFILCSFVAYSQCKYQKASVSYHASFDEKELTLEEKPVKKELKGFQDPIRLARERFQKKPHFSFRSANGRPIAGNGDQEPTATATTTQPQSGAPCASGSCKNAQEQMERKRVEWLKKTVLEKLRLSAPPNVTSSRKIAPNSPVMRALLKEYGIDQMKGHQLEDDMDDEIKSQKLISTAREAPFNGGSLTPNWFFFDFSPEERENFRVKSASIWYYVRNTRSQSPNAFVELDVYRPYFNETINNLTHIPQRHTIKRMNLSDGSSSERWQHIPITSIVSSWLEDPSSNYGVKLFSRKVLNLITTGHYPNESGYKPFLEVQLVASHRRRKRSAPRGCRQGAGSNSCCLHDFKINFHEIGWDWIIYPTSYNAKFCAGECVVERVPSIHRTIVQASQDRHVSSRPAEAGRPNQPRSCCVPNKYAPLSMLYYDNNGNVVYSDVPDMEIRKCNCV